VIAGNATQETFVSSVLVEIAQRSLCDFDVLLLSCHRHPLRLVTWQRFKQQFQS